MWKLKVAEGGSPLLRTRNNHVGRQIWVFDPELGSPEEIMEVEKAREQFHKNRFNMKNSADLLLRLQFGKENPIEVNLPQMKKLGEEDSVTDEILSTSLKRALGRFSSLQAHDGHWPADFGSPMFLMPGLIITLYVTGNLNTVLTSEHQREIRRYLHNHQEDLYTPHPLIQDMVWASLQKIEQIFHLWPGTKLRKKALYTAMKHIHYEDEKTHYVCVGPVNKVINMLCCWVEDPHSEAFKLHLPRIYDYLWIAEDGMKMQGYNGTQLWDTVFAVQAIISTNKIKELGPTLKKAHEFIKQTQIIEDCPDDPSLWYRHISKGAWPFSTADNGYPVTDCTAESLKVAVLLSKISPDIVGEKINATRLHDAVNVILSFMNKNGGFGTYGVQKLYSWMELFNPSETFENIIVDHPCVECTSAAIQALKTFKKIYPTHRGDEIEKCIMKGASFIEKIQRPDGSWYGNWGICFTYGTWFGVAGLVAAGRTYNNSSCIRKACNFLLSKQLSSGGWGESFLSYYNKIYTNLNGGHSHAVNTAWALLALLEAGQGKMNPKPLHLAAKTLINMQMECGEFPQQNYMGASTGSMSMGYAAYRNIFPIWALGEYHNRVLLSADQQ